jgi:O-acetyl-ADP-ribose deacetylase (regulator of RNase III)
MLDDRLTLTETDLLAIDADVLVVEDNGWLTATRGLAAQVDEMYPELCPQREGAVAKHGGPFPLGEIIVGKLKENDRGLHHVVWVVTQVHTGTNDRSINQQHLATPLLIEQVTRDALKAVTAHEAKHVAMPALGTRVQQHVLPPNPKKLPRYVMGAAQLIGIRHMLDNVPSLHVSLSLTQRDRDIFLELLGQAAEKRDDKVSDDD